MLQSKYVKAIQNCSFLFMYRLNSTTSKNATKLFFEPKVQAVLQKLSAVDLDRIFVTRKTGERLKPPEYKFMTDEELQQEISNAQIRGKKWQQMPPVLSSRNDETKIITVDPSLDGHDADGSKFVFTDITFGVSDKERLIVVRENDGTLKHADWDQRHRMTETYLPRPGREHNTPKMFFDEYLESLMNRKEYVFILDRACIQFEPDDPEYIRITSTTYQRVAQEKDFGLLYGTRHYGSLLFYLVLNKQIDSLLLENFQNDRLQDAVSLVHLYYMLHPESATTIDKDVDLIKNFIQNELSRRNVLELALQTCLERLDESSQQSQSIVKNHGVETP